ncbi:hypothetical protein IID22_03625 [Patescibacteria group bacterium]|nr:hypothetical protein [Patescibacteria group bacterium]
MILDFIGWTGAILILLAYFLVSTKRVLPKSRLYHSLNLLGALGIGVNSYAQGAFPATGLNVVWSLIAIYGLLQGIKK